MTEHEKKDWAEQKAMFSPLHNTHTHVQMHTLLVRNNKERTIANTFTHHQYRDMNEECHR